MHSNWSGDSTRQSPRRDDLAVLKPRRARWLVEVIQLPMPPILIAGLFRELSPHLLALLRALQLEEWQLPTSSSERTVKDIAAHLLDGSLRRLSGQRDGYRPPGSPNGFDSDRARVDFLNRLNDEWTQAARRLSPRVLTDLIAWSDPPVAELFELLDPFGPGIPVAWAGERESACWFDVAREYTERWHHTQQIFAATGRPSTISGRRLCHPCLDTLCAPCRTRIAPSPLRMARLSR